MQWSAEFSPRPDGNPDPAVWRAELGDGGWGCDQRQTYIDDARSRRITDDGQLAITADDYEGQITSARLITKDQFAVQYGRIAARIKVPGGLGTWPAFWLLGQNIDEVGWPACGEIDVMEHVGSDPTAVHGTVHGPGYSGLAGGLGHRFDAGVDLSDDFHVYGVDWSPDGLIWTLDAEPYADLTRADVGDRPWPFDQPFYLLINLAIGGAWPGNDTDAPDLPATLLVDWIRIESPNP